MTSDATLNAQMLEALQEARTGLLWYQDQHPESANGSDDEAMTRIDAAITAAEAAQAAIAQQVPTVADAELKALYIDRHGSDAGWLGIEGSYFISGVQARSAQQVPAEVREPLSDEQIDAGLEAWFTTDITTNNGQDRGHPFRGRMRAAIKAAHGITAQAQQEGK